MKFSELPYKAKFSAIIKPLVSKDKDKYLALASQVDLKDFVPNIDSHNIDLLPIAFNAFVVNRVNKNRDVMDTPTALAIHAHFKNKPINIEHDSGTIVGVLLSSGFSEFGTDKTLTEEEVKDKKGPFNVVLGGVLWRAVDEDLTSKVEDSSDPESVSYGKISASWEVGFAEYDLVKVKGTSKNMEDGVILGQDHEEYKTANEIYGSKGHVEDTFYYRKPVGFVLPLGIGLTGSPAAEVRGIATHKSVIKANEEKSEENEKKISQAIKSNVTMDEKEKQTLIMKFSSIAEVTNESLKTAEASAVRDLISDEIKKASDKFEADKTKTDDALALAKTQSAEVNQKLESAQTELKKLQEDLKKLQDEKVAVARVETFGKRMATIDEKYELSDASRKVVAAQVKSLDDDASFEKWQADMSVFLTVKAAKTEETKKADEAKLALEAKASADKTVADALENAKGKSALPPNAASASTKDKWANALKEENVIVK